MATPDDDEDNMAYGIISGIFRIAEELRRPVSPPDADAYRRAYEDRDFCLAVSKRISETAEE